MAVGGKQRRKAGRDEKKEKERRKGEEEKKGGREERREGEKEEGRKEARSQVGVWIRGRGRYESLAVFAPRSMGC